MDRLTHTITISAPRDVVWQTMLDKPTYEQWTSVFAKGSTYEGDWEQGSTIRFVGPGEDGVVGGMVSRIAENRPHEFVSIEHLGEIGPDNETVTTNWQGGHENYTFRDHDGGTELTVELDVLPEYAADFNEMWPKALAKLKELAET